MEERFTAVVIDDNRAVHRDLIALTNEHPLLRNLVIKYCGTTCRATRRFLKKNGPVDVVLCDIELKDENGLLEAHKFFDHTAFFVLITVYPDHKEEAWDRGVHGYIVKPVDPRQIRAKLDDLSRIRKSGAVMDDPDRTLFIKDIAKPAPTKVRLGDIHAITVDVKQPNILCVATTSGTIRHRKSLMSIKKRFLDTGLFVQLDQSTLVSRLHVIRVDNDVVFLTNGFFYPVSKRYSRSLSELVDFLEHKRGMEPVG